MNVKLQSNSKSWIAIAIFSATFFGLGWLQSRYTTGSWPFTIDGISILAKHGSVEGDITESSHDGHDHSGHSESNSLKLSESAKKNLGLTEDFLRPIELEPFQRSITVPALVVDRPGRTRLPVNASMTGIVTHVHAVAGEAIQPGDLILEMRLTHEDLVTAQKDYLQSLGDRDIELKEISRIETLANTGAISSKTLLERQYSRDKIESLLRSQREALRLHGLSESQINMIETKRRLLTEMRVIAPRPDSHSEDEIQLSRHPPPRSYKTQNSQAVLVMDAAQTRPIYVVGFHDPVTDPPNATEGTIDSRDHDSEASQNHLLVLQDLNVQKGQIVNAGDLLCTLADYSELLVEGQAFESEAGFIAKAKLNNWKVSAITDLSGESTQITNLELGWVNNEIDPANRILKFYVALPNVLTQDTLNPNGQRFIAWKYRTGQRMQLLVPVERWEDQIVMPVEAVVREAIDSFVFQQNGDHFERIAVHERYRDQKSVVIENDGTLYPGDVLARRGAHQMQMALKNKSGGAVDPHAGHSH